VPGRRLSVRTATGRKPGGLPARLADALKGRDLGIFEPQVNGVLTKNARLSLLREPLNMRLPLVAFECGTVAVNFVDYPVHWLGRRGVNNVHQSVRLGDPDTLRSLLREPVEFCGPVFAKRENQEPAEGPGVASATRHSRRGDGRGDEFRDRRLGLGLAPGARVALPPVRPHGRVPADRPAIVTRAVPVVVTRAVPVVIARAVPVVVTQAVPRIAAKPIARTLAEVVALVIARVPPAERSVLRIRAP
jgi:hypothetical protein